MVVTAHWVEENWNLNATLLELKRFLTPHTGDAMCAFLKEFIEEWELKKKDILEVRTENASDKCNGLNKLCDNLNTAYPKTYRDL